MDYKLQIKLGWALFVTYTIIQSIMRSEMCSLHLTHPSVHTWSSGQPTVQRPGSSHGLPVGAGINWSLNAIDTIETWVSGNLTALTERSQPAILPHPTDITDIAPPPTIRLCSLRSAGLVKRVWPAPDQWLRDQMAAYWAGFTSLVAMSCMCFCVAEVFFLFSHCTPQGA